jgi:hypothetical protein
MARIGNLEGIVGIKPSIKEVGFDKKGYITIHLNDGRLVYAPIRLYPSIKRMNREQRNDYFITDGQIIVWDYCNEV